MSKMLSKEERDEIRDKPLDINLLTEIASDFSKLLASHDAVDARNVELEKRNSELIAERFPTFCERFAKYHNSIVKEKNSLTAANNRLRDFVEGVSNDGRFSYAVCKHEPTVKRYWKEANALIADLDKEKE